MNEVKRTWSIFSSIPYALLNFYERQLANVWTIGSPVAFPVLLTRALDIAYCQRVYMGGSDVSTLQTIERTRRGGDGRRPPHINHTFPANPGDSFTSCLCMAHPAMDGSTEIRNGTNMRGWPQEESSCLGLDPILRPCERGLVREYSAAL